MQFYNEYEILQLKIEELWNIVDYFIITEGRATHTGIAKSLNFQKNHQYFDKYLDKIIYQPLSNNRYDHDNEPKFAITNQRHDEIVAKIKRDAPWDVCVDYYSRDIFEKESSIVPLLDRCKADDIVILGDCDEIPKAFTLQKLINNFDTDQIYHLHHDNYWYYINLLKTGENWYGNIVLSYQKFLENSFCNMRQNKQGEFVPQAGYHFSYMPVNRINEKLKGLTHQDLIRTLTKEGIDNSINNARIINKDIYNRPAKFEKVDITYESHPKYLVDHLKDYEEYILE